MIKTENRPVEVKICDFCGEETSHLSKCVICGKEMCSKGGNAEHAAFSVEVYKYGTGERTVGSPICKKCSGEILPVKLSIGEILDMVLGKRVIIAM